MVDSVGNLYNIITPISSMAGTGGWQEYAWTLSLGTVGWLFSETVAWYLSGPTPTYPLIWYCCCCDAVNMASTSAFLVSFLVGTPTTIVNTPVYPATITAAIDNGTLTQDAAGPPYYTIDVAAGAFYCGDQVIAFSAGSVTVGAYGTYYVYYSDPTYNGGAETFLAVTNSVDVTQGIGYQLIGSITVTSGGGATGQRFLAGPTLW